MAKPEILAQIVHLSDLHVCKDKEDKPWGWAFAKPVYPIITKLTEAICRQYPKSHVVITGDITDTGSRRQLENAWRALSMLNNIKKLSVVPGNHDDSFTRDLVIRSYQRRKKGGRTGFNTTFQSLFPGNKLWYPYVKNISEKVAIVGLDSTEECRDISNLARGRIGWRQLFRLEVVLKKLEREKRLAVVLLHHHPFELDGRLDKSQLACLIDAKDFLKVVKRPCVVLVLFGHKHQSYYFAGNSDFPMMYGSGSTVRDFCFRVFCIYPDGKIDVDLHSFGGQGGDTNDETVEVYDLEIDG
jgi:3',5'-cyclic AMP phosphodiesterase CpdA